MSSGNSVKDNWDSLIGLDRRNKAGNNIATLLHNYQMAYETGDDALIVQSEFAVRGVLYKPLVANLQMAHDIGDDTLIVRAEQELLAILPPQREPGVS